jgi:lipoprotein-anchoring transpeptidase ErfK/SrfK
MGMPRTRTVFVRGIPVLLAGAVLAAASPAAARVDRTQALPRSVALIRWEGTAMWPPAALRSAHVRATIDRRVRPALLVRIDHAMSITSRPGAGPVVGVMPDSSKFLGTPTVAWVMQRSRDGRFGRVPIPYSGTRATGWIALTGLATETTPYSVVAELSRHRITVLRFGEPLFSFAIATGAARSPTPVGRFFVSDRVPVYAGSPFGSFAFGLSGIQTHLPPGWGGSGDQLAIHGTNDPASIGRSASAGCLRVSESALARLEPILRLGTPVVIEP